MPPISAWTHFCESIDSADLLEKKKLLSVPKLLSVLLNILIISWYVNPVLRTSLVRCDGIFSDHFINCCRVCLWDDSENAFGCFLTGYFPDITPLLAASPKGPNKEPMWIAGAIFFTGQMSLLVSLTLLVGQQEGHPAFNALGVGLLVVAVWLELCTSYSSSRHHHFHRH